MKSACRMFKKIIVRLCQERSKKVGAKTLAELGKPITLVSCVSVAGSFVSPMIIYPRKRMAAHHQKKDGPVDIFCTRV